MWLASIFLLAGACSAALDPVVPTPRPTQTPAPPPSATPTSDQPVMAAAPATPTRIVPPTATPGPSPTPLMAAVEPRPFFSPTPTTIQAIPGTLRIDYFTTDATDVGPGDTITLYWMVRGAEQATIYRVDTEGVRGQSWSVGRFGSLQVRVPMDARETARFLLETGDTTTRIEQALAIPLGCVGDWFFSPAPGGCPASPPLDSVMAQQGFERGRMFWIQAEARIYVLFNDGQRPAWAVYADAFRDGQPESDPGRQPPQGLFQPVRGFGLVWREQPGIFDRIGWAIAPESSYEGVLQGNASIDGGRLYLRDQDGIVFELVGVGASWRQVIPGG